MARFSTVAARRFVLVVWPLALWSLARHQPPWSDEAHFLVTVRQFGSDLSLELLRSYDELSAPLSYIAYAAWGHLVGFDASRLRLLSSVFASLTLICYTLVLMRESRDTRAVVIAVAIVAINPYFVGLSVFVFTDMLALLGMVVLWSGVQSGRAFATGAGLAVATLTRQYSAFLAAAIVISVAIANADLRATRARLFLAALGGMLPLAALIVFWNWSLSPDTYLRGRYLAGGVRFDPHALSLYLACPGLYLLPLAALTVRRTTWIAWLTGTIAGVWVVVFPVRASAAQLSDGIATVGFAHRAMVAVGGDALAYATFVAAAIVGMASMATWFRLDAAQSTDCRTARLFPWVAFVCFLAVMPFSFQPWEKYALPELVICTALFARYYAAVAIQNDVCCGVRRQAWPHL